MPSTPKIKTSSRIFSIIQLILGLMFITLLFTVRFGEWYERVPIMDSYENFYYDFFITDFVHTAFIAAGIVLMYLLFIATCITLRLFRS